MKKLLFAIALLLIPNIALAQSSFTILDSAGATKTVKSNDCSSTICPIAVLVSTAGAAIYGTAGTANANVITVQGIASMTPFLTTTTLAAETTKVIGTVNQGTSPWVVSGTVTATPTGTQAVSVASGGIASGSIASGAMVDLGSQADAACGTATGTCSLIALQKFNNSSTAGPVPAQAGTIIIGGVGIDQTTVGTTNAISLKYLNTTAIDTSSGNKSAGTLRITPATDTLALAAWGHVATGAAPPAGSTYVSALGSGATGGLAAGLIQCDQSKLYDASTNGSTELQALTSGRTIYVCGYAFFAGGTVSVKLIYGTGTACATGSNNMTPAFPLTAQVGIVDRAAFAQGLKTASANALCINTNAAVAVQAMVYYSVI